MRFFRYIGLVCGDCWSALKKMDQLAWNYLMFRCALYTAVRISSKFVLGQFGCKGIPLALIPVALACFLASRQEKPTPSWMEPAMYVRVRTGFGVLVHAAYLFYDFKPSPIIQVFLISWIAVVTCPEACRRARDLAFASVLEG